MTLEQLIGGNAPTDVWSKYVPILQEKNQTTIYITDSIEAPSEYNEACHLLNTASPAEHFYFIINTPGGYIDSAVMLIDAIKNSAATTTAKVTGTVASAGTIITLACDNVEVADHSAFMIHNYSSAGISGKGHELKAMQNFTDKHLNDSFRTFYKGFLTPREMQNVIDGQDLWMDKEEVMRRVTKDVVETEEEPKKRRGRPRKLS